MLLVTIIAYALLLWFAFLQGRSLLFPPAFFCSVWLASLLGLVAFGDAFYPVADKACLVYLVGGLAFTAGGMIVFHLDGGQPPASTSAARPSGSVATHRFLDFVFVALVLGLPLYWRELTNSVSLDDLSTMFHNIRYDQVLRSDEATQFSIVRNLGGLATFTAMAMVYESNGEAPRRWRAIAATILALVYGSMTAAKSSSIALMVTLSLLAMVKSRRVVASTILLTIALGVGFFVLGILFVNLAFESFGSSSEFLLSAARTVRLYWLGGLVGFGFIAHKPDLIPSTQPIDRFYLNTARSLGANVDPPPLSAEFTNVSLSEATNDYTIYFSYFKDHGWIGTVVLMFALGAFMVLLYRRAISGRPIATIFFAHMAVSMMVMSLMVEGTFSGLNTHFKMLIFLFFVYRILPAFQTWRATWREAARA